MVKRETQREKESGNIEERERKKRRCDKK